MADSIPDLHKFEQYLNNIKSMQDIFFYLTRHFTNKKLYLHKYFTETGLSSIFQRLPIGFIYANHVYLFDVDSQQVLMFSHFKVKEIYGDDLSISFESISFNQFFNCSRSNQEGLFFQTIFFLLSIENAVHCEKKFLISFFN